MNSKRNKRIKYYTDELKDDFSGTNIDTKEISKNFKYVNSNVFFKIFAFWIYYLVAVPLVWCFNKLIYSMRFKNKKVLRLTKKQGYFLYANHVLVPGDAFTPGILSFPKKAYIVANPDAYSIKYLRTLVKGLGAIPTPFFKESYIEFFKAIKTRLSQGNVITIFPEAKIWPYYTKIRNFNSTSFKLPVKFDFPSYCFTTVFKKRKMFKKPRAVIYIDGPFYPDKELAIKEQEIDLRNKIYEKMVARSKESDCEYIKYIKIDENNI